MTRILISSNDPYINSGYGRQAMELAKWVRKLYPRIHVTFIAWNLPHQTTPPFHRMKRAEYLQHRKGFNPEEIGTMDDVSEKAAAFDFDDTCNYFVNPYDTFPVAVKGSDVQKLVDLEGIEAVITIQDILVYGQAGTKLSVPTIAWIPVHNDPLEERIFRALWFFDRHVAMSRFGMRQIEKHFKGSGTAYDEKKLSAVPHIVSLGGTGDALEFSGLNDAVRGLHAGRRERAGTAEEPWRILMVAANNSPNDRKGFVEAVQSVALLQREGYHVHLRIHSWIGRNIPLQKLAMQWGMRQGTFDITTSDLSEAQLIALYADADIFLMTSKAEGFGLPLWEAQLAGLPVVATNFGTMGESVFCGVAADIAGLGWDGDTWWAQPSVDNIKKGLIQIMTMPERFMKMAPLAAEIVARKCSPQTVGKTFLTYILSDIIEHRMQSKTAYEARTPITPPPRLCGLPAPIPLASDSETKLA